MTTTESNILDILSGQLSKVQASVIALFIPHYYPRNEYILVIENNDGVLTCIEIGKLLGLQTLHIEQNQGKYISFPDGMKLNELMELPFEFNDWFKESVPK